MVLTMVYITQNHWVSGLYQPPRILVFRIPYDGQNPKTQRFWTHNFTAALYAWAVVWFSLAGVWPALAWTEPLSLAIKMSSYQVGHQQGQSMLRTTRWHSYTTHELGDQQRASPDTSTMKPEVHQTCISIRINKITLSNPSNVGLKRLS
jgi:hypothetical protein